MFSTLTSILPSGMGFGAKGDAGQERDKERANDENTPRPRDFGQFTENGGEGKQREGNPDEQGVKKKRERNPYETFIVVRPPPSVSNHPLNLQLQLVPPQAKERAVSGSSTVSGVSTSSNRRSVDISSIAPEGGSEEGKVSIDRSPSLRSNRSDPSLFYAAPTSSSTASMSSISSISTTSSVGGRRMIVPLYNLSAHNVMTNTVLDAGTDAKVAKFHKRNLEVLALAVLECIEVWPGSTRGVSRQSTFHDANGATLGVTQDADNLLHTPTSSAISLSSAGSHPHGVFGAPATPIPQSKIPLERGDMTPTPQNSAKKIFGKIFKKKDSQISAGHTRMASIDSSAAISVHGSDTGHSMSRPFIKSINRRSLNSSIPSPASSHFATSAGHGPIAGPPVASGQLVLLPQTLGIQPLLASPTNSPTGRPTRYVWIVRRWLKNADSGLLGGVMRGVGMVSQGIANMGLNERGGSGNGGPGEYGEKEFQLAQAQGVVEVRFEWVRGPSKSRGQRRKSTGQAMLGKRRSLPRVDSKMSSGQESISAGPRKQKSLSRVRHGTTPAPAPSNPRRSGEMRRSMEGASREQSRTRGSPRDSLTSTTLSEETSGNAHARGRSAPVGGHGSDDDDGEESDPEDSETPWTCTLVLSSIPSSPQAFWENEQMATCDTRDSLTAVHSRPRSHISAESALPSSTSVQSVTGAAGAIAPGPTGTNSKLVRPDLPGTLLRLKVGTLSPAPHHPKVVSQLKVPYPLPDVDVPHARVRKRHATPVGVARPTSSKGGAKDAEVPEDSLFRAEEIKDIMSCTAFWLVVREGFGGVGKEKRKGDGWRIRG